MNLENVLLVSAILFAIGLYGVMSRRSIIAVLMSIEIMFSATVVAAIAFSRFTIPATLVDGSSPVHAASVRMTLTGHAFAIFVIAVAAAEVALGLAIMFALYRARETTEITDAATMKN